MKIKTLFREYNNIPIQLFWDQNHNKWWYSASDIIKVLVDSKNPRIYWHTFKDRNPKLNKYVKQFKILTTDNKNRLVDTISQEGINELLYLLPSKNNKSLIDWLKGLATPSEKQSKERAYSLWYGNIIDINSAGTVKCLLQIHAYIFDGIYDYAGKLRNVNMSKGGFEFANCMHFHTILPNIEKMPQSTLEEIVHKYIEMNIAHPFREGNGRATRIWLDLILKKELKLCIDWSKISKKDYFAVMVASPYNPKPLLNAIKSALTDKINDREIFMKGIDTSYYYEEVGE